MDTPAALVRQCDVVFICLLNSAAHEAVLFGDDGMAVSNPCARIVVDNSMIDPEVTRRFAGRLRAKSAIEWGDAPGFRRPARGGRVEIRST